MTEQPDASPDELAAIERERSSLSEAVSQAQLAHLSNRVMALAVENARLKERVSQLEEATREGSLDEGKNQAK